jgi:nitrogen regulatory protein PII
MERKSLIKITAIINRSYTSQVLDAFFENNIQAVFVEAGRTNMLTEKKTLFSLGNKKNMSNDPGDILHFFISPEEEILAMELIDDVLDLSVPGKGSVFSNDIQILQVHNPLVQNPAFSYTHKDSFTPYSELACISCIVQRGSGDAISHLILDSGISVPATTYGLGTGVRDKLGLLRITIPAEKEITTLLMSKYDVDAVIELMIVVGKLDQPGKGFIYDFPVRSGFVNTKISSGSGGQVASLEQIIAAIDSLKGGIGWRKSKVDQGSSKKLKFLENLVEMSLICSEGYGFDLMKVAMDNGAPGATIGKTVFKGKGNELSKVLPSQEICRMIVAKQSIENIADALIKADAFNEKVQGLLYIRDVSKAFTYTGK